MTLRYRIYLYRMLRAFRTRYYTGHSNERHSSKAVRVTSAHVLYEGYTASEHTRTEVTSVITIQHR